MAAGCTYTMIRLDIYGITLQIRHPLFQALSIIGQLDQLVQWWTSEWTANYSPVLQSTSFAHCCVNEHAAETMNRKQVETTHEGGLKSGLKMLRKELSGSEVNLNKPYQWIRNTFGFCHSPVDFLAYSRAYPCLLLLTLVLTPAYSRAYPRLSALTPACWCTNIDGRMTKATLFLP